MSRWIGRLALIVVLALGLMAMGCGDGDDGGDEAVDTASPRSGTQHLDRFLMRTDEEPGFDPVGRPRTDMGVKAFVRGGDLTQAEAQRLRSNGFISFTFQPTRGPQTAGVTNVHLFGSAEGAKHHMGYLLRRSVLREELPGADIRRFTVPGVPGARGFTASKPHVGNVHWVQGRCMLVLGNQGPGPFAGPLSTGARAIYERTNGQCP